MGIERQALARLFFIVAFVEYKVNKICLRDTNISSNKTG